MRMGAVRGSSCDDGVTATKGLYLVKCRQVGTHSHRVFGASEGEKLRQQGTLSMGGSTG